METRSILVSVILCVIGLALFAYGMSSMSHLNTVANSFLIVFGIFIGMAGLLVLGTNLFSKG